MISRIQVFFRNLRRVFSRSEWAVKLLRLPRLTRPEHNPGLVMVQIDGFALTQFNRAIQKEEMPFLSSLLQHERYTLHSFYSGLPANTPSVQGELFYGIKGCVPAFNFMDRKTGVAVKMFDAPYVEKFEPCLKEKGGPGLLTGGSSYSNIYSGGATEAHFCWAKLGWEGVWHAINPLIFPFLIILYIDIFVRMIFLLIVEFFLAVFECIRGTLKGRLFLKELEAIYLRVLVCVFLRELMVVGVTMDIARGLPVIHLNFLGYDEQAHCRGPSSKFAHWSLGGIDKAIRRIAKAIHNSPYRGYDLWVYSDHGQDKTTPYFVKYGRTIEEAVKDLFGVKSVPAAVASHPNISSPRARFLAAKNKQIKKEASPSGEENVKVTVTAMGPLGHIYVDKKLSREELQDYARKLVFELKLPLVMIRHELSKVLAFTPRGTFVIPDQIGDVLGHDHPFLEEMKEDIVRMCYHPDAGEWVIAGWSKGEKSISFPAEFGAHAAMAVEETRAFALLPVDAPVSTHGKSYLRAMDLREAAQRFLEKQSFHSIKQTYQEIPSRSLRLMSYNVHGCLGMDGYILTDRISRVIARHNPDIIALQELDVGRKRSGGMDQVEKIARKLEMKFHFHPVFRYRDEKYGNAILSQHPMALMKMEPLPKLADKKRYEPRGAMWILLEFQGAKINVINTHLSIWPRERLLQINALLNEEWLGHPDCAGPIILCGDFNALPGSAVYQKICQRLKDSQAILAGHRPHRTWFGHYPLTQIDYIFVTSEFQVKAISVSRTSLDKVASDHLPLIVDLKLAAEKIYANQSSTRKA